VPALRRRILETAQRGACRFVAFVLVLAASMAPLRSVAGQGAARCDASGAVRDIRIDGSRIETDELLTVLATRRPTLANRLLRVGDPPCVDSLDLAQDALRIAVLHRQRGWFTASVRPLREPLARGVRVRFEVTPGPLARVRTVTVRGLPDATDDAVVAPLRALEGAVFDRVRVQDATDRAVAALQDAGFARTRQPTSDIVIDTAAATVELGFTFTPGAPLRLGEIVVEVAPVPRRAPRYSADDVRRLAGLVDGAPYRARDVLAAQRALYRTEAFRLVLIDTVTPAGARADSALDLRIAVADARTRSARVGAGWGTLECGRLQGRLTDRGFLGPGRRVEFTARASRLGIGRPVDQFPGLCPQFLRDDPYSQELNYHLGVSLSNQSFFGVPITPTVDVYSERRGEYNAFQQETDLGLGVALSRAITPRTLVSVGAEFESGRIVTDAVLACVRFALCQPSDFALARQGNTTRAVNFTWLHDRVGATADPRDGGRLRADVRVGDTRFGEVAERATGPDGGGRRTNTFVRPTLEASGFTRLAGGTIAARVQWSQVYAPGAFTVGGVPFLPPQERLFSGGQNSVRGYQQNLLGPVVYRVTRASVDSVPLRGSYQLVVNPGAAVRVPTPEGGTGSLLGNLEYRRRFGWPTPDLQWAAFLDAGTVWATGIAPFAVREVRATPGVGVRLDTPLGPFRVDIGYNPRRADAGKAFLFDAIARDGGPAQPVVLCVSPGQELTFDEQVAAGGLACPRTFRPVAGRSVLSRLVFHFSLGQAF
jgi:outer membrane protein insertion porin family/translocation and assembly module TamA